MSALKKQAVSGAIGILTAQADLPLVFEGTKLYGEAVEDENDLRVDGKVYHLFNETGTGQF